MQTWGQKIHNVRQKTLARHLGYYVGFCFLTWFFHLLLISFLTFIHLQLNHSLKVVDEWFFQNAWMIISFSSFCSLAVVFHMASLWSDRRQLLAPLVHQGWIPIRRSLYIVLAFLWMVLIIWGRPEFKMEAEFFKNLISILGISIFYGVNIFLVGTLNEIFPLVPSEKNLQIILFPFVFWFAVNMTFPYPVFWGGELAAILMFCLYLFFWKGENWTHPALFLVGFVAPACAFLGCDPLWESYFSFGKMTHVFKAYEWSLVLFISWFYLLVRRKEHFDFKDIKFAYAKMNTLKEKFRGSR